MGILNTAWNIAKTPASTYFNEGAKIIGNTVGSWFGGNNNQNKIVNTPPKTTTSTPASAANDEYSRLLAQLNSLSAQPAVPTIPSLNLTSIYNQAKNKAATQVNPYFQKQLNDFLAQQNVARTRANEDYQNQIGQLEQSLQHTLGGIETQKGRTEQDVTKNLGDIQIEEGARQQSEGRQFDTGIRGLQENLAQSGLTFSGLGKQQLQGAKVARGETEQAQARQVQNQQYTQKLMKERTLADLSTNADWSTKQTEESKKMSKQDLDRGLENMMWAESAQRSKLEFERLNAVESATRANESNYWRNYLDTLKSPQQKEYAAKIYGSYF